MVLSIRQQFERATVVFVGSQYLLSSDEGCIEEGDFDSP
uniref:Uncharacterized protein n=1 Tax=Rhizophora mucronata TaxID=61149 RepID=A0A2P2K137_RHIMU